MRLRPEANAATPHTIPRPCRNEPLPALPRCHPPLPPRSLPKCPRQVSPLPPKLVVCLILSPTAWGGGSLCGVGEWEVTQLNSAPLGTLCPDLQPRQGCRPRGGLVLVCTRVCLCVQACTDAWGLGLSTCAEGAALLTAPSERAALFLLLPHGSSHCLTLDETFTCHQFLVSSH